MQNQCFVCGKQCTTGAALKSHQDSNACRRRVNAATGHIHQRPKRRKHATDWDAIVAVIGHEDALNLADGATCKVHVDPIIEDEPVYGIDKVVCNNEYSYHEGTESCQWMANDNTQQVDPEACSIHTLFSEHPSDTDVKPCEECGIRPRSRQDLLAMHRHHIEGGRAAVSASLAEGSAAGGKPHPAIARGMLESAYETALGKVCPHAAIMYTDWICSRATVRSSRSQIESVREHHKEVRKSSADVFTNYYPFKDVRRLREELTAAWPTLVPHVYQGKTTEGVTFTRPYVDPKAALSFVLSDPLLVGHLDFGDDAILRASNDTTGQACRSTQWFFDGSLWPKVLRYAMQHPLYKPGTLVVPIFCYSDGWSKASGAKSGTPVVIVTPCVGEKAYRRASTWLPCGAYR